MPTFYTRAILISHSMVLWSYKTIIDSRLLSINMLWLILNKTSCDRNLIQLELGWWHNWWSMLHIICRIWINFRRKACFCWRVHGEKADSRGGLHLIEGLGCTLLPLSLVGLKCCHWFTGVLFSPHCLQLTRSNKSLKFGKSSMVTHVILNTYHQVSNIRCTQSPNINVSCLVLQLSLPNPLKPSVKLRMKM